MILSFFFFDSIFCLLVCILLFQFMTQFYCILMKLPLKHSSDRTRGQGLQGWKGSQSDASRTRDAGQEEACVGKRRQERQN